MFVTIIYVDTSTTFNNLINTYTKFGKPYMIVKESRSYYVQGSSLAASSLFSGPAEGVGIRQVSLSTYFRAFKFARKKLV